MKNLMVYDELNLQQLKDVLRKTRSKRVNLENCLYSVDTEQKVKVVYSELILEEASNQLTLDDAPKGQEPAEGGKPKRV